MPRKYKKKKTKGRKRRSNVPKPAAGVRKSTRVFSDMKFSWYAAKTTKAEAEKSKKMLMDEGWLVRITESKSGRDKYQIWRRRPKRKTKKRKR